MKNKKNELTPDEIKKELKKIYVKIIFFSILIVCVFWVFLCVVFKDLAHNENTNSTILITPKPARKKEVEIKIVKEPLPLKKELPAITYEPAQMPPPEPIPEPERKFTPDGQPIFVN